MTELGVSAPAESFGPSCPLGLPIARRIQDAGGRFCPHYLGRGIGLLASAHLLAVVGGDSLLEIDTNPNPLRSLLAADLEVVRDGKATLSRSAGSGIEPDLHHSPLRTGL